MKTAKTLPTNLIFFNPKAYLVQMEKKSYTNPVLKKGKTWHVEYYFNGTRYRLSEGINRIKDVNEKERQANILLVSITNQLADGFDPEKPQEYLDQILGENISLDEAVKKFLNYHEKIGSRKKTIQSYASKLKYFTLFFANKNLKQITTENLEDYFYHKINVSEKISFVGTDGKITKVETIKWSQNGGYSKSGRIFFCKVATSFAPKCSLHFA